MYARCFESIWCNIRIFENKKFPTDGLALIVFSQLLFMWLEREQNRGINIVDCLNKFQTC